MAANNPWTMDKQFRRHDLSRGRDELRDQRLVDAKRLSPIEIAQQIGVNDFGRPEGIFVYGKDRTTEREFACDLDLSEVRDNMGVVHVVCVGVQLLCPRCGAPLYVKSPGLGGDHEIELHFNRLVRSTNDGKLRPTFTIDGHFGCDYSDHEMSGVQQGRDARIQMKCGWRGGVYKGRCFDHDVKRSLLAR